MTESFASVQRLAYLAASLLFILSLRGLSTQRTARRGNTAGVVGMALAVAVTALALRAGGPAASAPMVHAEAWGLLALAIAVGAAVGAVLASRVAMTSMPELVAILHSFVGAAAVLVGIANYLEPTAEASNAVHGAEIVVGVFIGAITFTGSVVAFAKLRGTLGSKPLLLSGRHVLNGLMALVCVASSVVFLRAPAPAGLLPLLVVTGVACVLGAHLVLAIGGGDMPVVVSMLNSYSGWAAAASGFLLNNDALIITGALVGSSGAILSYIMCKGMNRSFISVILGGFGGEVAGPAAGAEHRPVKLGSAEDAAYIMKNASKVIIVPGYGMAVAQAQHALREMADKLKKEGVEVKYAIHPVAGRMPGHMNVLLAEANVPYDEVFELEDINSEFAQADVAFVIGANDVTNPAAEDDKTSPIYGMPVLQVWKAGTVMFIKRSLASGYAGIDNPLFYRDNTMMLLGDAKKMTESIVKAMS
ncbi:MAG TPA: NAD(P)(+) transhydrogenase (Re/Si-specific) subunit beta [Polyangiaceae bacterium]